MINPNFTYDPENVVKPLDDADEVARDKKRNRAKVGSARPSSLLYTYGPGAIMDLPHFTVMPTGFDDWEYIWKRREGEEPPIEAARLRDTVRALMRSPNLQLRGFPWQPKKQFNSNDGDDLGVPARVFPQWFRCTGCDFLGLASQFSYSNTSKFRPDDAKFEHERCRGRNSRAKVQSRLAVAARYLLVCTSGHLDEFPYERWVHGGGTCAKARFPRLKMDNRTLGKGASAIIRCESCRTKRPMNEAQGEVGATKLPKCRGRHPHLSTFDKDGCREQTRLMLIGASNLWFPVTQSVIVMPTTTAEMANELVEEIRKAQIPRDMLQKHREDLAILRVFFKDYKKLPQISDADLGEAVDEVLAPAPSAAEQAEVIRKWDPVDLLVPEWQHLLKDPNGPSAEDEVSGLTLSRRERSSRLPSKISRVLAVERLRKVNALVGFTRVDSLDRTNDQSERLVPLARTQELNWTVATEDRGEGVFIQLDEERVAEWERKVVDSSRFKAHKRAHRQNFENRTSDTAGATNAEDRFPPPRYWLIHTFAHVLMREMAQMCGYSAASLSERIYAWNGENRPPAAGFLICTTASDSDGTLGGLVQLSQKERLAKVVDDALRRATRCSSDPICAMRIPKGTEDFLHGAACHCCAMASETSCEKANRFLDRNFLVNLQGEGLGFFGYVTL